MSLGLGDCEKQSRLLVGLRKIRDMALYYAAVRETEEADVYETAIESNESSDGLGGSYLQVDECHAITASFS